MGLTAMLDVAKPGDQIFMVLVRLGRRQRRVRLDGDRPNRRRCDERRRQDARAAGRAPDLPRLRHVREVPRQDPQGRVARFEPVTGSRSELAEQERRHERRSSHRRRHDEVGRALGEVAARHLRRGRSRSRSRTPASIKIDSMYVGCMTSGLFVGQEHLGALLADYLGMGPIPATRVETACASGGVAFRSAFFDVASRRARRRARRRRREDDRRRRRRATYALSTAADQEYEVYNGVTFPGLYAMMAVAHMNAVRDDARAAGGGRRQEPRERLEEPARAVPVHADGRARC